MPANKPPITHVCFDMDGILLDTESIYTKVTEDILLEHGITSFPWEVKAKMMGQPSLPAAKVLVDHFNLPLAPEQYVQQRDQGHAALFPHCNILPGVLELVTHLKKHGIPMCVATSSHTSGFQLKTSRHAQLFDLFEGNVICGDDPRVQGRGKPHPQIFLEAAGIINASDMASCLVFEDSPSGMVAGLAAGMQVVAIPDVQLQLEGELAGRVNEVLTSMEHFQPEKYGLPPFRG